MNYNYFKCISKTDSDKTVTFFGYCHVFIQKDELESLITQLVAKILYDELGGDDAAEEDMTFENTISDITKDDFDYLLLDYNHTFELSSISNFANLDDKYVSVWRKSSFDISDRPQYYLFSVAGDANSANDADCLVKITSSESREDVIQNSWYDCINQSRRYFHIGGMELTRSLFIMEPLLEEEYNEMNTERNLIIFK